MPLGFDIFLVLFKFEIFFFLSFHSKLVLDILTRKIKKSLKNNQNDINHKENNIIELVGWSNYKGN